MLLKLFRVSVGVLFCLGPVFSTTLAGEDLGGRLHRVLEEFQAANAAAPGIIVHVESPSRGFEWTAAVGLAEQPGNQVRMSYRGESFRRIKPKNHQRVEEAVSAGGLDILWNTNLVRIESDSITYRNGGPPETLPNDYTFIFAGGELPTRFLRDCGVEIETRFGKP